MFYGFGPRTPRYKADRGDRLAEALADLVKDYSPDHGGDKFEDKQRPYVERVGPNGGPCIRRITHLSDEDREALVKRADAIYNEVMGP